MGCKCGKVAYATRGEARSMTKHMNHHPYRCKDGCWHTSSHKRAAKKRRGKLAKLRGN